MGQHQGKASGWDTDGAGRGLSPAEVARSLPSLAGSHPHPWDAGQGHGPFPPIVWWRQGHGFLLVTSPTLTLVSAGAGASIPAGRGQGARTSRAGGLRGTESAASNTSKIHRAAFLGDLGRNTQADEEQNPSSITGWKTGV